MEKKTYRKIEKYFFNYKKLTSSLIVSTVDIADKNMAVDYSKPAVDTSLNNAKEVAICDIIDKENQNMRWVYVVEKTLDHYKFDTKSDLIKLFYFDKKGKWRVINDISISERTFRYWRDDIIEIAYKWAKEFKLLGEKE